jgi:hypothetical protein
MLNTTDDVIMELMDLSGRKIRSSREKLPQGNSSKTLNISDISAGIYLLNITGKEVQFTQKIIKK